MADNDDRKSTLDLAVSFYTTGETPRISAAEIAGRIRVWLAIELDLADARVEVTSSHLNHVEAYEADAEQYANQAFAEGVSRTLRGNLFGNPDKDGSN